MKLQFYVGMGLGVAAGATASMLMQPRQKDMKKAMDAARQTLDRTLRKFGV